MAKNFRLIRLIALCLVASLCFSLVACRTQQNDPSTAPTGGTQSGAATGEKTTYTIKLKSEGGMALADVGVYVYTDETKAELVWFAKTDAEGTVTFTDKTSDSYIAVLDKVPEGYMVEESYPLTGELTEIVLAVAMAEGDLKNITYKLGDAMQDFTVIGPDGTVYTLSEILKEKKAVVLNFWYIACQPCKMEFPYLQRAWEEYSEDIFMIGMNPVDTDDAAIAQYQKDNGITFPLVQCSPDWATAMQLTAYPTTVIIDRYGNITLIHKGSIPDAKTITDAIDFFVDEDYEQTVVENIEDLAAENFTGTIDNPTEIGGVSSFELTVKPGEVVYCNIYKIMNSYMEIADSDAYVIYNGTTYNPSSNGYVTVYVSAPDTYSPFTVGVGNSGDEVKTFTVYFYAPYGTYGNPITAKLGEFTTEVYSGNDQGVYYKYYATESGTLTLENISATAGVEFDYVLYNLDSYAYRTLKEDAETGTKSVSVKVSAGDTVQIIIGTVPDSSFNYPYGYFRSVLKLEAGEGREEDKVEKIPYSVTVTDETGKPMVNVNLSIDVEGTATPIATNAEGVASIQLPKGTYVAKLTLPDGYTAAATEYTLTEAAPSVTVKLEPKAIVMVDYTVKVLDPDGNPVVGTIVIIGNNFAVTNSDGEAKFNLEQGVYTATVSAPAGMIADPAGYTFAEGASELVVNLTSASTEPDPSQPTDPSVPDETDPTVPSETDPTIPSETDPTVPSETDPTVPSETDPTVPSETDPTVPSETDPTVPDETDPTVPSETDPTVPSETDPTVPSETDPTVPSETDPTVPSETDPTVPDETDPTVPSETDPTVPDETDPTVPSETDPTVPDPTQPIEPVILDYTVTVTDGKGAGQTGILVQLLQNGVQVAMSMTDANGRVTFTQESGDYTVSLVFSGTSYYYDKSTAVLSANKSSLTIKLAAEVDPEDADTLDVLNGGSAYRLYVGTTHVELGTGKSYYSAENGNNCFFIFVPEEAGTYRISLDNANINLSHWGTTAFQFHQGDASENEDNAISISIQAGQIGNIEYVIGVEVVEGITDAAITITRVGEPGFDISAQPWSEDWKSDYTPAAFTAPSGTLTYVDVINGTADQYKAVYNETDGCYHLGTADGPILYMNLGANAPYISIDKMINGDGPAGGAPLRKYFFAEDGTFLKKEDYTATMLAYLECMDEQTGIYPVTADLIYMIQNGGEGWWTADHPSYVIDGANEEIGWMFAVCYFA